MNSDHLESAEHATPPHEQPNRPASTIGKLEQEIVTLELKRAALIAALQPFANFACDLPCDCYNCIARRAIAQAKGAA